MSDLYDKAWVALSEWERMHRKYCEMYFNVKPGEPIPWPAPEMSLFCEEERSVMKYRKKPIVIEAEQFFPDKRPWPKGVEDWGKPENETRFTINTLEGEHIVTPGDWIIIGIKGERYPCKPDIFEATYEEVK